MKHMTIRMIKVLAVGLLGLTFLSACATPPPVPDNAFYRITLPKEKAGKMVLDGVVEVGRFSATGSLGSRPLLMSNPRSNAVTEYHYHFWIEAPPTLLQSALVSNLRTSNVAKQVVTPEMRVTPDYTVMGRILRMETVRGANPSGAVTFELALRKESTGELLVLKEYSADVPSSQDRVQDGAIALEHAVHQTFTDFIADIRKLSS